MPLLVLDDDPAIRSAVRRQLRDLVDVLPVASRAELERVLLEGNHGLVGALVDVSLGPVDPTGGLVAHTRLRATLPDLPVVFFTADEGVVPPGAPVILKGSLSSWHEVRQLALAVRERVDPSLERETRIDRVVAALADRADLSIQERVVARLLAHGRRGADVCKELDIGRSTFRTHCVRVYAKTGTDDAEHWRALVHTIVIDELIAERNRSHTER